MASCGADGEGRPCSLEKGHISEGKRDATESGTGPYWTELSAAVERSKAGVFRHVGKNFTVIETRGLIKREIILRFSLELEMVYPIFISFPFCSTWTPIGSFRCVAACKLPVVTHHLSRLRAGLFLFQRLECS